MLVQNNERFTLESPALCDAVESQLTQTRHVSPGHRPQTLSTLQLFAFSIRSTIEDQYLESFESRLYPRLYPLQGLDFGPIPPIPSSTSPCKVPLPKHDNMEEYWQLFSPLNFVSTLRQEPGALDSRPCNANSKTATSES